MRLFSRMSLRWPRLPLPKPRLPLGAVLEVAGAASLIYGIGMINVPAAFIAGGTLAVLFAQGVHNGIAGE
jgi:hypothetical protein